MKVKEVIKQRRKELGMTLAEIAKACHVSEATVSRWESGEISNMKVNHLLPLAKVLKISPMLILGYQENNEKR